MVARPLTQQEKEDLLTDLTGGVEGLATTTADLLFDRPGFIASTGPLNPLAEAARTIQQYSCRQWARSDQSENSVRVNRGNAQLCTPYLDSINELPVGGILAPPGTGGQCDNVLYTVNVERRTFSQGQQQFIWQLGNPFTMRGPITVVNIATGSEVCAVPTTTFSAFELRSPNNVTRGLTAACTDVAVNYRNLTFSRVDGLPDTCGDAEPQYVPPSPVPGLPPLPPTIPVFLPGVGTVNVNVGFNPTGNITVGLPDLGVETTIGGGEDGGGGGGDPTSPGAPGGSVSPGPGGEAEGEAGDGEELVGVLVEVLSSTSEANRYSNNSAQPFRGIGYVRMGYPGRLGVDVSGGTVISPQFFHAQQRGLTAWAVSANVGFSLRTTPYYRTTES